MFLSKKLSIKFHPKNIFLKKNDDLISRFGKCLLIYITIIYSVLFVSLRAHAFENNQPNEHQDIIPVEDMATDTIVLATNRSNGDIDPNNISLRNANKYDDFFRRVMIPGTIVLIVIISLILIIIFYPKRKDK